MHILPVNPAIKNNRIHILEIIGNASVGGMENYIKNFLTYLPAEQFCVTCICPFESPFTEALRQLGVENVFITPIEDDPQWRSIQLAIEIIKLYEIDLIHAHMPKAHVLAGIAGQFTNKPVIATIHGMHITAQELGITRIVQSHLITNCREAYTQALALGVPAARVNMVSNGVDVNAFKPYDNSNQFRKVNAISTEVPVVGFVGRLDFEKGPDFFLYAAEYIHYHKPDVHFIIAGEGTMRNELEKMCRRFSFQSHVHFINWTENTAEIYSSINVLAHTSRSDGTSLVLLEAMACECLTAAFAVGGVQEIIENRSTGLLAGPGDCETLGRRIIQLLEQTPEQSKKMGKAARARVEKNFNVRTNTLRTAEILQSIFNIELAKQNFSNSGSLTHKDISKDSDSNSNLDAG